MKIDLKEIMSLSEFQRNAKDCIEKMKGTGKPQVLTINGKAEVIVQDADSYQQILDLLERAEAIIGIQKGLDNKKKGKGMALEDFEEYMRLKYKIGV